MNLWGRWHRAMVMVAGASVLAACYAVTARGQQGAAQVFSGDQLRGNQFSGTQTVTVASLQIPPEAWHHFDKAKSAAEHHRDGEFEREAAKALQIAPNFAQMYLLRATTQSRAHQFAAAAASAQAAAKADPGAMWTSVVLAGAYNGMRRFGDALLVLDAIRGREAETWQVMYERARAEVGARDAAAALHWSSMALCAAPAGFGDAQLVRANALVLAGRLSEAASQIDIYLQSRSPSAPRADVEALRDAVRMRLLAAKAQSLPPIDPPAEMQIAAQIASR